MIQLLANPYVVAALASTTINLIREIPELWSKVQNNEKLTEEEIYNSIVSLPYAQQKELMIKFGKIGNKVDVQIT